MKKQNERVEIIWEIDASKEAQDRLLAAFEMIFKDVAIETPVDRPI